MNSLDFLPEGVRLAVSPLSWANDVLEDLGADISLETCLLDAAAAGYQGVELGRKFPREEGSLRPLLHDQGLALASGGIPANWRNAASMKKWPLPRLMPTFSMLWTAR